MTLIGVIGIVLISILLTVSIAVDGTTDEPVEVKEVQEEHNEVIEVEAEPVTEAPQIYTEQDAIDIAKVLYNECRGIESDTEKACVAWVILNRVDKWDAQIGEVVKEPYQFAYYENTPVDDELLSLAHDVLSRWEDEKNGGSQIGRVLPSEYIFFTGNGMNNHFRKEVDATEIWNYSLETPYQN